MNSHSVSMVNNFLWVRIFSIHGDAIYQLFTVGRKRELASSVSQVLLVGRRSSCRRAQYLRAKYGALFLVLCYSR